MTAKDARDIIRAYQQAGFRVEKKKHVKVFSPSGQLITVLSGSRCGGRADANARADLRRVLRQCTAQGRAA